MIVTDCLRVTARFVCKGREGAEAWDTVWIPVIPATPDYVERLRQSLNPGTNSIDAQIDRMT